MKNNLGLVAFFGLVILLLVASFSVLKLYNQPLGPSLNLNIPPGAVPTTFQPAPRWQVDKVCAGTGVMNLILIGQASPMLEGHYGADAVRLAKVDFDSKSVAILSLPSDLWVGAAVLDDPAQETAPLNQIYQQAYLAAKGNSEEVLTRKATETLAQVVVDNFGFIPDHYATVQGEPFVDMVNTLGGIIVTVPGDILDVPPGWSTFYSGTQTLGGKQTLDYVRLLLPAENDYEGLLERFERQNQVLHALLEASLRTENWSELPNLIKTARRVLVTDLSTNQADDLACMVEEAGRNADLIQLPPEMVEIDGQGRLIPDLAAIQELIATMGQNDT